MMSRVTCDFKKELPVVLTWTVINETESRLTVLWRENEAQTEKH